MKYYKLTKEQYESLSSHLYLSVVSKDGEFLVKSENYLDFPAINEEEFPEIQIPADPQPVDRVAQLEEENAFIAFELVETQLRLDQVEQENADLIFMLVEKGVI